MARLQNRRKNTTSAPLLADLLVGEICLVTPDGELYWKKSATELVGPLSPSNSKDYFCAFTDCFAAVNTDVFTYVVSGTGADNTIVNDLANQNGLGFIRHALGTVATNRVAIWSGQLLFNFNQINAFFEHKFRLAAFSNVTNTYTFRSGFIGSVTAETNNGLFFRYTNAVNGGRFEAVSRNTGVETAVDTGITATAAVYTFKIVVNQLSSSNEALFYINNELVATITTNIITATSTYTGYGMMILRSAGTAVVNPLVSDYISVKAFVLNR